MIVCVVKYLTTPTRDATLPCEKLTSENYCALTILLKDEFAGDAATLSQKQQQTSLIFSPRTGNIKPLQSNFDTPTEDTFITERHSCEN